MFSCTYSYTKRTYHLFFLFLSSCPELKRNSILQGLESIIKPRRHVPDALPDQFPHKIRCLPLRLLQHEAVPEMGDSLRDEARKPAVHHQLYDLNEFFGVGSGGEEGFDGHFLEPVVGL
jgi:hypothetical protein